MIEYRTGDASQPTGPAVIAHIVNDTGRWGAGFTASLDERWPAARESYRSWGARRGGQSLFASVAFNVIVLHLCAQRGVRSRVNQRPLRLDWLDLALADAVHTSGALFAFGVHMPRIGCGLAGGSWSEVEPLIQRHLSAFPVYVYDLERT